ncbi:hypothetical protein [Selenihalanaerobacter shriftii]|uniref:Uncharacterized protein n=1 Tax=Selenihalanaerobacter shriftii TaxID=142842 RepID=A0A1T4QSC4_9FIRM|nr:hypothetical protein [Selenihalanaerobacter shriftii]SKA06584.1 hypothetical protein SAMN02745118_02670 [Selenihalanaerobacter shriftii]
MMVKVLAIKGSSRQKLSVIYLKNPIPESNLNDLCVVLDGFPQSISIQAKAIEIW